MNRPHTTMAVSLALFATAAFASKPRLRLERVDTHEEARIRVYASLVEIEGQIDASRSTSDFTLLVDGQEAGVAEQPVPFLSLDEPLDLALVVETAALYGPPASAQAKPQEEPLSRVKKAVQTLLSKLPAKTRVLLVDYAGHVTSHLPFRSPESAGDLVDDFSPDQESGDLQLVGAMSIALKELSRRGTDPRRVVVVVSDGINAQMERRTFRLLGDAAAQNHIPIHSIAYSPTDERGPLLNLGEISKRSHGTFRWARSSADLLRQMEMLAEELERPYVLTFKMQGALDSKSHVYQLRLGELTSNRFSIGAVPALGLEQSRFLRWVLWPSSGLLGAGLLGFVILRRGGRLRAELFVLSGTQRGRRVLVSHRIVIGKRTGRVRILDDPTVSGRHAMIFRQKQDFVLIDLGSTNGTFVNGQCIGGPTLLGDGDELWCGNTGFRLHLPRAQEMESRS